MRLSSAETNARLLISSKYCPSTIVPIRSHTSTTETELAKQQERRRIAMELHDQVGQLLAVSKMQLDVCLANENIKQTAEYITLKQVRNLLDNAIWSTRTLTSELNSACSSSVNKKLLQSLYPLAAQIEGLHNISINIEISDALQALPAELDTLLLRISRELLYNTIKHAKAKNVQITIECNAMNVQLNAMDDGIGFQPSQLQIDLSNGFGIVSIRDQLKRLNGQLIIDSSPGEGARVTAILPLR